MKKLKGHGNGRENFDIANTDIDFIEIAVTDAHMVITFSKNRKHACPPNSSSARFIWPFTSVHIRFEVNDSKS